LDSHWAIGYPFVGQCKKLYLHPVLRSGTCVFVRFTEHRDPNRRRRGGV